MADDPYVADLEAKVDELDQALTNIQSIANNAL